MQAISNCRHDTESETGAFERRLVGLRLWPRVNQSGKLLLSEESSYCSRKWTRSVIRLSVRSREAAWFVFRIVRSLLNLTGTSAAVLPMCLSNFKAIWQFKIPISWFRDFTRSYEKTSFWILRRGPVIRTLHDCPSQMNENLLTSNNKLTSDSELFWRR